MIVAPPTFVTMMLYPIGCPGHVPPVTVFVTDSASTGAGTVNATGFVYIAVELAGTHAFSATTYAVFETVVTRQTGPTVPVIVKVKTPPGGRLVAALLQLNTVPVPATLVTAGVGNPDGSLPVALMTTGDIVSMTERFVTVASPLFVTTIW